MNHAENKTLAGNWRQRLLLVLTALIAFCPALYAKNKRHQD
jgi:hypothetical protein